MISKGIIRGVGGSVALTMATLKGSSESSSALQTKPAQPAAGQIRLFASCRSKRLRRRGESPQGDSRETYAYRTGYPSWQTPLPKRARTFRALASAANTLCSNVDKQKSVLICRRRRPIPLCALLKRSTWTARGAIRCPFNRARHGRMTGHMGADTGTENLGSPWRSWRWFWASSCSGRSVLPS